MTSRAVEIIARGICANTRGCQYPQCVDSVETPYGSGKRICIAEATAQAALEALRREDLWHESVFMELEARGKEIDRLQSALAEAEKRGRLVAYHEDGVTTITPFGTEMSKLEKENADLRQRLAECERDARRYRWLRESVTDGIAPIYSEELIDAALSAEGDK